MQFGDVVIVKLVYFGCFMSLIINHSLRYEISVGDLELTSFRMLALALSDPVYNNYLIYYSNIILFIDYTSILWEKKVKGVQSEYQNASWRPTRFSFRATISLHTIT